MSLDVEVVSPIRILVVDDSAFMRTALSRIIACEPDMEVVGTACCASAALEKVSDLDPDVVTLDLALPGLDGLATLRRIMHDFPRPVIMVSSATEKNVEITFQALSAGAFDYVPKRLTETSLEIAHIRDELITKIRAAAQLRRTQTMLRDSRKLPRSTPVETRSSAPLMAPSIVSIGLSTGGPRALEQLLPRFPADFPIPILIVQHMPFGYTAAFAQRLDSICSIKVKEATRGELIRSATAYVAPAGLHMRVVTRLSDSEPAISLDKYPENAMHIPSADEMMISVAQVFKNRAIGVIMTGMGADGAAGMTEIFREGGITIGQDEASCVVYGMPRVCAQLGVLTYVLSLSHIPVQIINATLRRRRA